MFQFENALNRLDPSASQIIRVQQTADSTLGFRAFEHTRILLFDQPNGELFIDFAEQQLIADCMYIIPATHLYSYSNTSDRPYLIFDVNEHHFKKQYRKLLYTIKYARKKLLLHPGNDAYTYSVLHRMLADAELNEQQKIKTLCDSIDCRTQSILVPNDLAEGHLTMAHQFVALLKEHQLSLNTCAIEPFAEQLHCSVRTLRRVCFDVFHCSPSYIIKYHLMLYGVYLLAKGDKSASVTRELGFSSIAAFDRFIKRLTTTTPGALKQSMGKIMH